MIMVRKDSLTVLLQKAGDGDTPASNKLFEELYGELRRLAHVKVNEMNYPQTMHTTALVHEAYLKLMDQDQLTVQDRAHFFALCSKVMRQILVDYYRKKSAEKRGGLKRDITLDESKFVQKNPGDELLNLDQALQKLNKLNKRLCTVVECKFFATMKEEEIALHLGLTNRTIRNDWRKARMWLSQELAVAS
jgi:RNA polymerase sigma-70 factor, ECF subfamily